MDPDRVAAILRGASGLRNNDKSKGSSTAVNGNDVPNNNAQLTSSTTSQPTQSAKPAQPPKPPRSAQSTQSEQRTLPKTQTQRSHPQRVPSHRNASSGPPRPSQPTVNPANTNNKAKQPIRPVGVNSIVVSTRQKGNPLLQYIQNVAWQFADINPDYVTGATSCVLFLSLKYHQLHPHYIYGRINKLGKDFDLRILLLLVDVENHANSLMELTKASIYHDLSIIVAFNPQEAAIYLSQLKRMETASPSLIQGQTKTDYKSQLINVMTKIRSINSTDAVTFVANFGSFKSGVVDGGDTVEMIGGWGAVKAKRFRDAVNEPFIYNKKYKPLVTEHEDGEVSDSQS
jgi:DNA excision repair protein ERCC-1